ncbi:TrbL/VirB6 plasmid conjugal transfer protein [Streptosporangium subroseum]|uniref:TrbL/VirB6 plasmid conjugal transfer protein n=1 Tax=Streptosporangium subroseum TaxID=106412 RepID=A0A239NQP4_9ACTN|nr:TrbL/VirB6 plasmid conjugal transfer protein [Streptosporangium subroseum]
MKSSRKGLRGLGRGPKGPGEGLKGLVGILRPRKGSKDPGGGPRPGSGPKRSRKGRLGRRIAIGLVALSAFLVVPLVLPAETSTAVAAAPCDLSPDLAPEVVGGGVDGLLQPPPPDVPKPGAPAVAAPAAPDPATEGNYARYGMSGQFWHTHLLGCDDVAAVMGNAMANTVFSWAKALDRLTITTYQAAATEGPLESIKNVVDDIVTRLSDALYWPFLRPIVILGAIWLAWYGLIRKRATTTAEGVIWMVLAVTVAVWFFSRPGDFTGLGKTVTDATGEVVNSAFSGLPGAGGATCLPGEGDTNPQPKAGGYGQQGTPGVDQNADALWSILVCKPWLMGEFGTADANAPVVKTFGATLLGIQALDATEMKATETLGTSAHQARYQTEVADKLQNTPIFFLFQGKDWTNRLGVAIGALMAALIAGLLIFLVAISLLALKVGFLLLLILAPVFLLIGVHPGSGRIIAMRWVEMVVGTLLRQAVLALVLGLLIYGYALIISMAMPWGMQVMFMALLTIAVFFYRRPFQHLFSSMDGHTLTTRMLGDAASAPTLQRAAGVLPPVAAARAGRWGMRKAEPVLQAAAIAGGASVATAAATVAQGKVRGEEGGGVSATGTPSGARVPTGAQPAPLDTDAQAGGRRKATGRPVTAARPGAAPPLNLSGAGKAGGTPPTRSGGSPTRSGGGWFGGRSGGGWAPQGSSGSGGGSSAAPSSGGRPSAPSSGGRSSAPSSGGRSSAPSSGGRSFAPSSGGGRSGGSIFGGGGPRRPESGSSRGGSGSGSQNGGSRGSSRSGGSVFGGGSGGSGGSSRSGSSPFGGSSRDNGAGRPDRSEAPPLWVPKRSERGREADEAAAPFWLRPRSKD